MFKNGLLAMLVEVFKLWCLREVAEEMRGQWLRSEGGNGVKKMSGWCMRAANVQSIEEGMECPNLVYGLREKFFFWFIILFLRQNQDNQIITSLHSFLSSFHWNVEYHGKAIKRGKRWLCAETSECWICGYIPAL